MSKNEVQDLYDLSSTEFEMYCYDILKGYAEEQKLKNFKIEHSKKIKAFDGEYEIDVFASFEALGTRIQVLCECKRYKNPVKRNLVLELHKKLDSIGANKGILMTNNRFQSGAIEYARAHGIALIQVSKKEVENYSYSNGNETYDENDPFVFGEKQLPPYKAILVTEEKESERVVYPTKTMIKSIITKTAQMINEQYGLEIDL
jgi:restriction system protein